MKLLELQISGCRSFGDLGAADLPMTSANGSPREWTVLVAENGAGKTTLLQVIGMLCAGATEARALIDDAQAYIDVRNPRTFQATALFARSDNSTFASTIRIEPNDDRVHGGSSDVSSLEDVEMIEQCDVLGDALAISGEDAEHGPYFSVGLGVLRRIPRPGQEPPLSDVRRRIGSLFGQPSWSTNLLDLVAQEFDSEDEDATSPSAAVRLSELMDEVIQQGLLERVDHIERRGKFGLRSSRQMSEGRKFYYRFGATTGSLPLPALWMSQGYQALLSIATDILGNAYLEHRTPIRAGDVNGLVLIDELDLHLHPRWQQHVVDVLRETFGQVQFVTTTHSPLLLPQFRADEIYRLSIEEHSGNVELAVAPEMPATPTSTELLATYYGVHGPITEQAGGLLQRYALLATDSLRSEDEDEQLNGVVRELGDLGITLPFTVVARELGPS